MDMLRVKLSQKHNFFIRWVIKNKVKDVIFTCMGSKNIFQIYVLLKHKYK